MVALAHNMYIYENDISINVAHIFSWEDALIYMYNQGIYFQKQEVKRVLGLS